MKFGTDMHAPLRLTNDSIGDSVTVPLMPHQVIIGLIYEQKPAKHIYITSASALLCMNVGVSDFAFSSKHHSAPQCCEHPLAVLDFDSIFVILAVVRGSIRDLYDI